MAAASTRTGAQSADGIFRLGGRFKKDCSRLHGMLGTLLHHIATRTTREKHLEATPSWNPSFLHSWRMLSNISRPVKMVVQFLHGGVGGNVDQETAHAQRRGRQTGWIPLKTLGLLPFPASHQSFPARCPQACC